MRNNKINTKQKIMSKSFNYIVLLIAAVLIVGCRNLQTGGGKQSIISDKAVKEVKAQLSETSSDQDSERISKGVGQLAGNWFAEDGSEEDFIRFCAENFLIGDELKTNFYRICDNLESLGGYSSKIRFSFTESERFTDVRELLSDHFFRNSIPSMDPYKEKLAHFVQLNFPCYTLEEKRKLGKEWSREKWAMVALGDRYAHRNDPDLKRDAVEESEAFRKYMQHYFLRMDHVCSEDGSYPFPEGTFLHSHRGLRDNCKEEYTRYGGYERQKLTGKVLEHILQGTVPKQFLEDTTTMWNPWTNELYREEGSGKVLVDIIPEGPVRYEGFRSMFLNKSSEDRLYPDGSSVITRTFDSHNLFPSEVEKIIRDFLSDPVIAEAGKIIETRLGRPLEPFDIWYSGFQEQSLYPADMLDSITMARYPDPLTLQNDLPGILVNMGFSRSEAQHIGAYAVVRPVVSGGYTDSPPMRGDKALMTTMFSPKGLDYKSYRVAMHELGHVVCAVYSADEADNFILAGVPTNGITEAMAELLAYKNVEGLGLSGSSTGEREHQLSLAVLWYLVEMGGQALTDIETWKWIYANPDATGEEVQKAVLTITGNIWNSYFADVFNGTRDQHILSIYNHYITGSLYLYNYFLGNVIMYQLHNAYGSAGLAEGLKEACKEGETIPELWMEKAVGGAISLKPVIDASYEAIRFFQGN